MGVHALTPNEQAEIGGFALSRAAFDKCLGCATSTVLMKMMRNFYEGTHRDAVDRVDAR